MSTYSYLICTLCEVSMPFVVLDRGVWMAGVEPNIPIFVAKHMSHGYWDDLPEGTWLLIVAEGDPREESYHPSISDPIGESGPDESAQRQ
jgi:hypothetical protein